MDSDTTMDMTAVNIKEEKEEYTETQSEEKEMTQMYFTSITNECPPETRSGDCGDFEETVDPLAWPDDCLEDDEHEETEDHQAEELGLQQPRACAEVAGVLDDAATEACLPDTSRMVYVRAWRNFKAFVQADLDARHPTMQEVSGWLQHLHDSASNKLGPGMKTMKGTSLESYYSRLRKWMNVKYNLDVALKWPELRKQIAMYKIGQTKKSCSFLTLEDIDQFVCLKHLDKQNGGYWIVRKVVAIVMFCGGLRQHELMALSMEDFSFHDTGITVTIQKRSNNNQVRLHKKFLIPRKVGEHNTDWASVIEKYQEKVHRDLGRNHGRFFWHIRAHKLVNKPVGKNVIGVLGMQIAKLVGKLDPASQKSYLFGKSSRWPLLKNSSVGGSKKCSDEHDTSDSLNREYSQVQVKAEPNSPEVQSPGSQDYEDYEFSEMMLEAEMEATVKTEPCLPDELSHQDMCGADGILDRAETFESKVEITSMFKTEPEEEVEQTPSQDFCDSYSYVMEEPEQIDTEVRPTNTECLQYSLNCGKQLSKFGKNKNNPLHQVAMKQRTRVNKVNVVKDGIKVTSPDLALTRHSSSLSCIQTKESLYLDDATTEASFTGCSRKVYKAAWQKFKAFVQSDLDSRPPTEEEISDYLHYLYNKKSEELDKKPIKGSSLESYYSRLKRWAQVKYDIDNFKKWPQLSKQIAMYKTGEKENKFFTLEDIDKFVRLKFLDDGPKKSYWIVRKVAAIIMFSGGLKRHELMALNIEDFSFHNKGLMVSLERTDINKQVFVKKKFLIPCEVGEYKTDWASIVEQYLSSVKRDLARDTGRFFWHIRCEKVVNQPVGKNAIDAFGMEIAKLIYKIDFSEHGAILFSRTPRWPLELSAH